MLTTTSELCTQSYLKLFSAEAAAIRRSLAKRRLFVVLLPAGAAPTPPTAPPSRRVSLSRLKFCTSACQKPQKQISLVVLESNKVH